MAKPTVMIIGSGLAGMAAAIKLAELDVDVSIMSLLPLKRSHSCCAQGGINSVNDLTRQLGDSEWKHFDDTVYGGDFLADQPPVKSMRCRVPFWVIHWNWLHSSHTRASCSVMRTSCPTYSNTSW